MFEFFVELLQLGNDALYDDQIVEGNVYLRQVKIKMGLLEEMIVIVHQQLLLESGAGELLLLGHDVDHSLPLALYDLEALASQIERVNHLTLVQILD